MNTHVTHRPEIQVHETEEVLTHAKGGPEADRLRSFRVVNEDEPIPLNAATPVIPAKRRRNGLMITACTIAVLVTAGGVFWISPYNHASMADITRSAKPAETAVTNPAPGAVGQGPILPTPIAPAARLARAPEPSGGTTPLRTPAPNLTAPHPNGDEMAEFIRLGGLTNTAAPSSPEKRGDVPSVPPAVSNPPKTSAVATLLPAVPEPPAPAHQAAVAEQHPAASEATVPKDAVAAVAAVRAAPMTDVQQVQVLDLVTQLGTLVRDQRAQIAQLRQDQQNLSERVDGSLNDFTRRISLSEARRALGAASAPTSTPAGARMIVPVVATIPADIGPHRYHVQAASPGLAMLSELDRSGGEERQLPISPGDNVPGWGKVVSISQRGTSWVVKTDHGLIQ